MSELEFMQLAIKEAKRCVSEDERFHPKVGAVIVRDGKILASAHRGELAPGDHAEYTALEKKLGGESLAGATVYTTLEPCTTRHHPKIPCTQRLIERKIVRVVIGILDPNPEITGRGLRMLRDANIATELFPASLMAEIEDLNRDFTRHYVYKSAEENAQKGFIEQNQGRDLDEWYRIINFIYWKANYYRDSQSLFTHLVEVVGGISMLASDKKKIDLSGETFIPKSLAWWMALCGKMSVESLSNILWAKFPYVCAYCQKCPHDPDECSDRKAKNPGPDWITLEKIGQTNLNHRPSSLGDWQRMFSTIYPAQQTEEYGPTFARLTEELGELAEAVRVFGVAPGYFLNEAADVFAWFMHIQNLIEQKNGTSKRMRGYILESLFCEMYPDHCKYCGQRVCNCGPILESTIGRITHELPGIMVNIKR